MTTMFSAHCSSYRSRYCASAPPVHDRSYPLQQKLNSLPQLNQQRICTYKHTSTSRHHMHAGICNHKSCHGIKNHIVSNPKKEYQSCCKYNLKLRNSHKLKCLEYNKGEMQKQAHSFPQMGKLDCTKEYSLPSHRTLKITSAS
jgi:hypothetical protein